MERSSSCRSERIVRNPDTEPLTRKAGPTERDNRRRLQVRAECQQTAIAILQHELARAPWHVGRASSEFDAFVHTGRHFPDHSRPPPRFPLLSSICRSARPNSVGRRAIPGLRGSLCTIVLSHTYRSGYPLRTPRYHPAPVFGPFATQNFTRSPQSAERR